ncbi:ferrous iron transport protein A [Gammaproteobacteria bacterium]|nr:ferrous iron transport protein A [Gammaproteobacteria bacterium]
MYTIKGYKTVDWALIGTYLAQGLVPGATFTLVSPDHLKTVWINLDGQVIALREQEFQGMMCDS